MLIQGGVGRAAKKDLMTKLAALDVPVSVAVLFCDRNGIFDGRPLSGKRSADPEKLDIPAKFVYVMSHLDPSSTNKWDRPAVQSYYKTTDAVQKHLDNGETVVVACVQGQNRSLAMCHALLPAQHKEPNNAALKRIAEEYHSPTRLDLAPIG